MEPRNCKECGYEFYSNATTCPMCGANLKKRSFLRFLDGSQKVLVFVIWLVFAAAFVISVIKDDHKTAESLKTSSSDTSEQQQHPTLPPEPERPNLEVLQTGWAFSEYGNRTIRGTVRNNTSSQYSYVQVEINLYDNSDTQVGSTFANVNNLEPDSTWRFEAIVINDSATKAKLKGVTGF